MHKEEANEIILASKVLTSKGLVLWDWITFKIWIYMINLLFQFNRINRNLLRLYRFGWFGFVFENRIKICYGYFYSVLTKPNRWTPPVTYLIFIHVIFHFGPYSCWIVQGSNTYRRLLIFGLGKFFFINTCIIFQSGIKFNIDAKIAHYLWG